MNDIFNYQPSSVPPINYVNIRAVYLACLFVLLAGLSALCSAQDSPNRFETGASFTAIHSVNGGGPFGVGLEGGVNFGRHFALDGTLNWLPERFGLLTGGRVVQALAGVRAGQRFHHFGVFVKARPGFITSGSALTAINIDLTPGVFSSPGTFSRLTERALDLGGVVEYYPARHWAFRYDLGNTMLFEEPIKLKVIGPVPTGFVLGHIGGATTNHFQFSTSMHYRF
jgi:hypothetical protein